jgi:hypothetical protein
MTDHAAMTTPKTIPTDGQVEPRRTVVEDLPDLENFLTRTSERGASQKKARLGEITTGGMGLTAAASTKFVPRSVTRRSFGLNMMLGLGGLHGAGGLTDRLSTSPSPRQFVTPVVLQPTVPEELWGTWVYHNQASAIQMIVERLELVIRPDSTGTVTYSRDATEYQTRCEMVELDQYTVGNWHINGQQLIYTGSGNSTFHNTCNPATDYDVNVRNTLVFSSYQATGNTMYMDTWPALQLTTIDSRVNPQAPLHNAFFSKVASPPSASWGDWVKLDGSGREGVAVASWAPNRRDIVMIGLDQALYHKWWDGSSWSTWERFGGTCVGKPAAVSWGPNRLDIFVVGSDGQVWHLYFNGQSWSSWEPFGGAVKYGVAAASSGPNELFLYACGIDNSIYSRSFNGAGWTDWQRVDSFSISAPAAVSYRQNSVNLACVGPGNHAYVESYYNSAYHGWIDLGPTCLDVDLAVWGVTRLDVFVRGADQAIYQRAYENSAWGQWIDLGGNSKYPVAAIAPAPNWLEIYCIGLDNALYQKTYK